MTMDRQKLDDAKLVTRVLAGDEKAFATLLERYAKTIGAIAFRLVRNSDEVNDLVQQTFFIAYRRLRTLTDPTKFALWIKGIARNLACKMLDKRERSRRLLERLPCTATAPEPSELLANKQRWEEMVGAINALDERHREVAVLRYLEHKKISAIAKHIGRPVGSVKRMLAEVRNVLRKELIEMAREEFSEYKLTKEQRERFAKIVKFPPIEPRISVMPLNEKAHRIRAIGPYGTFVALQIGAEACFADYDRPCGRLTMVSHVSTEGPIRIKGKAALRLNHLGFSEKGKAHWIWSPYLCPEGDSYLICAKQYGPPEKHTTLIMPDHSEWKEPQPKTESLIIERGSFEKPDGERNGTLADKRQYKVKIGRRSFRCIRRISGGGKARVDWSVTPVTGCATEEFFLEDGRLLLWRRYNGLKYSEKNPHRKKDAGGIYERLAEAAVPILNVLGEKYYLWYDQIPDYALH